MPIISVFQPDSNISSLRKMQKKKNLKKHTHKKEAFEDARAKA